MDANDRKERAGSEAADWLVRLQAGTMERAEREQFVEWLRESHIHVAEMLRISQIHGSLEHFQRWTRISTGPRSDADNVVQLPCPQAESPQAHERTQPPTRPSRARTRRIRHAQALFAVAAIVLLVVATSIVLPRIRGQVIETDRGERREVVLSDGSILQVDPETRLRVKYANDVRRVRLEHGRALFHVTKNPNRPFLVYADDTAVRAVGTIFGVEQQTKGVVITVAEGKVAVSAPLRGTASTQPAGPQNSSTQSSNTPGSGTSGTSESSGTDRHARDADTRASPLVSGPPYSKRLVGEPDQADNQPKEVFLTANQQLMVVDTGPPEPVQEVDSQRALAWAEGRLIFENEDIGRAVAEFNRYNRVQLAVTDPNLSAKTISGVFNAADPEAFIAFLRSVTRVEVVRQGDRSITIVAARTH